MGVVVQSMVAADAAGVAFSRDPLTGDPTRVVVTANFGLGEVESRFESERQCFLSGVVFFFKLSERGFGPFRARHRGRRLQALEEGGGRNLEHRRGQPGVKEEDGGHEPGFYQKKKHTRNSIIFTLTSNTFYPLRPPQAPPPRSLNRPPPPPPPSASRGRHS